MRIFGKNPVLERLRANPQSVKCVHIQYGISDINAIRKKAKQWNIPVIMVAKSKMDKIGRNVNSQGVLIDVDDFAYESLEEIIIDAKKRKKCIVFMDNLNDPQNLGAIIRSLACLGGFSIILPTHKSVKVTESVLRVASGGDSYVKIGQVANLAKAMKEAKDKGFYIAATFVEEGDSLLTQKFPYPLGLIIGSEQKGVRDIFRKLVDIQVSIPMANSTLSFNVASATAIIAYEITKQRKFEAEA